MSALAIGLLKKGCSVSGSDLVKNDETKKLEELGAVIFTSQIQQNIKFVISKFTNKVINFVVSSAIKPENEQPFLSKPIANADIPIPPIPIK